MSRFLFTLHVQLRCERGYGKDTERYMEAAVSVKGDGIDG